MDDDRWTPADRIFDEERLAVSEPRRGAGPALALCLVLLASTAGCFEVPVDESLDVSVLEEGGVELTARVRIASPVDLGSRPALEERIEATRRALLAGSDDWSRRFALLDPERESFRWQKEDGRLREAERTARVDAPGSVERFFGETGGTFLLETGPEASELALYPGTPARADRRQRRRVEEAIRSWSESVSAYLEAAADLYAYLDLHPERARVCLGTIFESVLPEEVKRDLGEPDAVEEELLDRVVERMEEVTSILDAGRAEAYTLDELSRLVFDPFPARIRVRVPGEIEEREGFVRGTGGWLEIPELGLWGCLERLGERWLRPDPLVALVRHMRGNETEPFDLDAFAALPRRTAPAPDAAAVESALRDHLRGASAYRVVWRSTGTAGSDEPGPQGDRQDQ